MKNLLTLALAFILIFTFSISLTSCDEKEVPSGGKTTTESTTTDGTTTDPDTTTDPNTTTTPGTTTTPDTTTEPDSTTKPDSTTVPDTTEPHTHTDGEWIVDKEPTSTEKGKRHQVCATCGETLKEEEIPAKGALRYEVNADGKTCKITSSGTYKSSDIVIDEYIDGYKVTAIGEFAFMESSFITSITIPKSVTSIERYAFFDCKNLKSVKYLGTDAEWEGVAIDVKNDSLTALKPSKTAIFTKYSAMCFAVLGQFSSANDLNGWDVFNLGEVKHYKEYTDRIYFEEYDEWMEDVPVLVYKVSDLDKLSTSLFGQTYDYSEINAQANASEGPTFDYSYDADNKEILEYMIGGWGGAEEQYTFKYDNYTEISKGEFEVNYHYVEQIWSEEDYEVIERIDTEIKGKIIVELVDGNYLMRSHTVTYPAE